VLTRGLGRSYGDASLPSRGRGPVACTIQADRVLAFDESTGLIRVEVGMSVGRLIDLFLPRGFFLPVTPGTRDVTIGGMVAADVHGKNHHVAGTFGAHVAALRLRLADGRIEDVSQGDTPELFRATLGGMGLTGHILDVTFRMERIPSRHIVEESRTFPDLESLVDGLVEAGSSWPFTVAWSDLLAPGSMLGRGVLACGRWATPQEAARDRAFAFPMPGVPFAMPGGLLRDTTIGLFNSVRYDTSRRTTDARREAGLPECVTSAESFFYPLDAIGNWNLLYGRRGFTQYQCVLPADPTMRTYRRLADAARSGGPGPFLVVLKDCGAEGSGMLSFPLPGVSFAMDFPVHDGTPALVARLNEVVLEAGGRVYLAKDAFTTAEHFAAMEPRLAAFREVRRRFDPDGKIDSALASRLKLR
jgi:decaprenylphospho-beta-D-ribofuranose 2-oxidase